MPSSFESSSGVRWFAMLTPSLGNKKPAALSAPTG
jgi:hypothetical protein